MAENSPECLTIKSKNIHHVNIRVRNYFVSKVTFNINIYEEKTLCEPLCINRPQELHTLLAALGTEPRLLHFTILPGNIKLTGF